MPPHFLLPPTPLLRGEDYVAAGGGDGLRAARALGPQYVIDEISASGLRGRGGAGFPVGRKWQTVRDAGGGRRFVVANCAEGEPATFKDRTLMRVDPHRIVEGAAIAALAVGATDVTLATKRSFTAEAANLRAAVAALDGVGLLGDLTVTIVEGPDEYLFGEEKALLEVIEGRDPLPRLLPPWQHGLYATVPIGWEAGTAIGRGGELSNPTVVNNAETLANVAHILANGATWFRSRGTVESPGTVLATVVGAVARPGVHEVELGTPFSELLERCGGPRPGRRFKAAMSGVSNPVLVASRFDVALSYEAFTAAGTGLGAAGFALYDDESDMVAVAREYSRFLSVESCGQCPPCKSSSLEITDRLTAIERGSATDDDLGIIQRRLRTVTDANRCYLGTEERDVVSSLLVAFPDEFAHHLEQPGARGRLERVPLVKDILADGTVIYDDRHRTKRPDWTFPAPTVPADPLTGHRS